MDSGSNSDLLNAEIDLNTDLINLNNAVKITLNDSNDFLNICDFGFFCCF